jgi:hypothetical protein
MVHKAFAASPILISVFATASAAEVYSEIPDQFQGDWAADETQCARGALSESRLRIEGAQITFYESRGQILGAAVHDDNLAVIFEATGEGYEWLEARQFELSSDGTTLTEVTGRRRGTVRIRCGRSQN